MAYLNYQDYMKLQQERQQRQESQTQLNNGTRVNYFGLKDDGDEAIVRFAYSSPDEMYNDIVTVHNVTIDGKSRKINCLLKLGESADNCPLCASGQRFQQRIFIRLIEYTRNEDGSISATPKVWERPATGRNDYVTILNNLFTEYGDISDCVFKIKRNGARGDLQTSYSIMFGNPSIYNAQLYVKDFTTFTDYKIVGGPVMDMTYDKMRELVADSSEKTQSTPNQTFTPANAQAAPQTTQQVTWSSASSGQQPPQSAQPVFNGGQQRITY